MERKLFEQAAKAVLDRFDPSRERKAPGRKPFFVELTGISNSGKTTLMDRLYVAFKAAGYEVAKVPEGAEAVPPPRELPHYNFRTGLYALEKALSLKYDRNLHLVLFDRALFDTVVRMEMYSMDGTLPPEDAKKAQGFFSLPTFRDLFDLHVFLMCDPDVALSRKYGADHAARAAAGELKYSTTTNPATMRLVHDAHRNVYTRFASTGRILWHDTSSETQAETADAIIESAVRAFERP